MQAKPELHGSARLLHSLMSAQSETVQAQQAPAGSFPTNTHSLTDTVPVSILGKPAQTFLLGRTLEGARCVLTQEVFATAVLPHRTLINVWTHTVVIVTLTLLT